MFFSSVVRRCARHACAVLALSASFGVAAAPNGWTITDLGAGYIAAHINNRGDILPYRMTVEGIQLFITGLNNLGVASAIDENSYFKSYLLQGGLLTELVGLSYADGINDAGQVVGYLHVPNDPSDTAALWRNGSSAPLVGVGVFERSYGLDINASGDAAGYVLVRGPGHVETLVAALFSAGRVIPIGLDGPQSYAFAINDDRVVVGRADTKWGFASHAFMYREGVTTDLGTLGGRDSYASDINNSGQIIGSSAASWMSNSRSAFLYEHDRMINLSLLPEVQAAGWDRLDSAMSINDLGQIVGYGTRGGVNHGFLLDPTQPVPEPATWALAALGLAALVFRQRASRRRLQPALKVQAHQPAR